MTALQVLDWELTEEDMAALSTLPVQQRMVNGATWLHPRGPYRCALGFVEWRSFWASRTSSLTRVLTAPTLSMPLSGEHA